MEIQFLKVKGVYTCVQCLKEHEIDSELNGSIGCYDSEISVDCDCGLTFMLGVDFDGYNECEDDDYE